MKNKKQHNKCCVQVKVDVSMKISKADCTFSKLLPQGVGNEREIRINQCVGVKTQECYNDEVDGNKHATIVNAYSYLCKS